MLKQALELSARAAPSGSRRSVAERGLDQLLVGDLVRLATRPDAIVNVRWLTGFTGTSGACVVRRRAMRVFLTDFRYVERAEREVGDGFERGHGRAATGSPALAERLRGPGRLRRRAHERRAACASSRRARPRGSSWSPAGGAGRAAAPAQGRRRAGGDRRGRASSPTRSTSGSLERGLAGRTEREVAARRRGADPRARRRARRSRRSSPPATNGALPHAEPSRARDRRRRAGRLSTWARCVDGYCSDCTRTFATGEPGDEAREVYELVRAAQAAALDAITARASGN